MPSVTNRLFLIPSSILDPSKATSQINSPAKAISTPATRIVTLSHGTIPDSSNPESDAHTPTAVNPQTSPT